MEVRVVLVEPEYEINIGYIARVMKNFGLTELYIVNPKTALSSEALIFAAHAKDIVKNAVTVNSIQEAVKGVEVIIGTTAKPAESPRNILRISMKPEDVAGKIKALTGKAALLFGRESSGLSNEELSLCDLILSIPADKNYPTLNVSHAAAIVFYELYKNKLVDKIQEKLERSYLIRLVNIFNKVLLALNMPKHKLNLTQIAFQRMLLKGITTSREATLMLGAFRRILKKIEKI